MNSAKWTWFAIGYQTLLRAVAFVVYQLADDLRLHGRERGRAARAAAVIYLLLRRNRYDETT